MYTPMAVSPVVGAKRILMVALATAVASGRAKIAQGGPVIYTMVWLSFPVFALMSVALIYRDDAALRDYAIVAGSATSFIFMMLYGASSVLDNERQRGTLGSLFLAPTPRYSWLSGFQLFSLLEMLVSATLSLTVGSLIFGIELSINLPAFLLTLILFFGALWGISMVVGSVGVAIRDANQLTNLLFPPILLLSGTMYPVDRMPDWLQTPARCLPFSYGTEALVASMTTSASIGDLQSSLLPLAGFAVVLPIVGVTVFSYLERVSRRNGTLEFM